jgi:putative MATE family efflux protein
MQNKQSTILDSGRINSLLMKLSVPIFFGMAVQSVYNIVDAIFIGRYVGNSGLAALSIIMPIQMLVMGAGNMVSIGGASLISRLLGRQETQKAERALGNSICFAVILSLILTLAVVPFVSFWLKKIGASADVLPYARQYLMITMAGSLFNITGTVLLSLARAEGNARVSMISMIIQAGLNIILDAVFMIGLNMGIAGAALATVISQGIAFAYVISYYFTGKSYLKIHWGNFVPYIKVVRAIFAIGVSQFLKGIADIISTLIIVKAVSRYGGDIGLSAFGIAQRVMMFASMPSMVLGQAMQPILGFNYGAKRFRQALKSINTSIGISTVLGLAALAILLSIPGPIIRIFTSDANLISTATSTARLMYLGMPLFAFFNVAQLVFPSIGKVWPTMLISVLRSLMIMTPLALILPHFFQISGVWLIFPGADTLSFVLVLGFLVPLIIKFRKAIKEDDAAKRALVDTDV